MGDIRLYFTEHAKQPMAEFGINKELVIKAITQGSKYRQEDGYLAVYSNIAVAYKIIAPKTYKIETAFLRR